MFGKRVFGFIVLVAALALFGLGQADAQTRRRAPKRTTPPPATSTDEPQIISTADTETDPSSTSSSRRTRPRTADASAPQATTISGLAQQVNALNQRIARMEANQRALADLEKLTRAEARADTLRAQLFAAQDRESALQSRLNELDFELQPENIENLTALNGSTRPEVMREQRRRYLEAERAKAASQLVQATLSRTRLEGAVASADVLVDKLRRAVDSEAPGQDLAGPVGDEPPARDAAPPAAPTGDNYEPPSDTEEVPSDKELVRMIKASLADAGISTVQVEAANGAVILTGDVTSAQVPAALQAAYDARPRKIYNQMTVK